MKTKYEGVCRTCGKSWKVGDEILFSKEPKAVCIDSACFEKQKSIIDKATQAGSQARQELAKSNWPQLGEMTPDQSALMDAEEIYCSLGYQIAKTRHPHLNDRELGPIVNATMQNLIQIAKIKAIRELRSQKE